MKTVNFFNARLLLCFFVSLCIFTSCSKEEPVENEQQVQIEKDHLSPSGKTSGEELTKMYDEANCTNYCITPESGEYYVKRGYQSVNVGPNTKEMSYAVYNTEDSFVVEVTYEITDGNANANATITIDIQGNIQIFEEVVSGTTVSHSVALNEDFADCEKFTYFIRQTALGDPVEFTGTYNLVPVCTGPVVEIGELVPELGGYVFYILQEGDPGYDPEVTHGLVAATEDHLGFRVQSPWSINDFIVTNATGSGIGAGKLNTEAIVNAHGAGNYAAYSCSELVLNGYDDWYLPSSGEMHLLRDNLYLSGVGNIIGSAYWTSTETSADYAIRYYISEGSTAGAIKSLGYYVRAIRSF